MRKETFARKTAVPALLSIVALVLVVFASNLRNGWIEDDHYQVENNPYVRSVRSLPYIFSVQTWAATSWETRKSGIYRPLPMASFLLDYGLFHGRPWGSHLFNDLLHALNAVLLFLLLRRYAPPRIAWFGALAFALHPIVVETVTWVSARFDLLSALFGLTSLLVLPRPETNPKHEWGRLAVFSLAVLGGCFSKETFFLVPVLALAALCFVRGTDRQFRIRVARFAAPASVLVLAAWVVRAQIVKVNTASLLSPIVISNFSELVKRFVGVLLVPSASDMFFPLPVSAVYRLDHLIIAALVLCAALVCVLRFRANPGVGFGLTAFFAGCIPAAAVLDFVKSIPERYFYLPYAGLVLAGVAVLGELLERRPVPFPAWIRRVVFVSGLVWLAMLSALTVARNSDWRDDVTLFARSISNNPANHLPYEMLALHFKREGNIPMLMKSCSEVLSRNPSHVFCLNAAAVGATDTGRYGEARALLLRARKEELGSAQTLYNLGYLSEKTGDMRTAGQWYRKALDLNPEYEKARQALDRLKMMP
ncbi:MAG: tetratricopeptide repeat protein [Pseudomonadota bacterium]